MWDRQDAMWDREMKRWDAERALWTVKEERLQQQVAQPASLGGEQLLHSSCWYFCACHAASMLRVKGQHLHLYLALTFNKVSCEGLSCWWPSADRTGNASKGCTSSASLQAADSFLQCYPATTRCLCAGS